MNSTSPSLLELQQVNLTPPIGLDYLLSDISFAVQQGEKIAVIGASGSGKTSLLRLLNRLVSPVEGEIYWQNKSYREYSVIELRRKIVLVPQEPKLLGMTGKEALVYPLTLQQLDKEEISRRLVKYCDGLQISQTLLEKTELQLSLGQRQLLGIARGLMLEPEILLLDEPTSALDRGICDRLIALLDQINQEQQTTIFMVNHQLDICAQFAQRIFYLNSGQLQENTIATPGKWQEIEAKIRKVAQDSALEWES